MSVRRAVVALAACMVGMLGAGCSALLSADPTPVPGAAATLTRSERTPIPTPIRTAGPSAAASPSARVALAASPSPAAAASGQVVSNDEVVQVQQRMEQVLASPALPGLEGVLLDHVSLSTVQGGSVLAAGEAATWLRDRAATGIKVSSVEPSTQTLMLQVLTDGWPNKDPISQGQVTFSLRRYDPSGRPDEEKGDWKIDVIDAE